jgi:hypothetical protein
VSKVRLSARVDAHELPVQGSVRRAETGDARAGGCLDADLLRAQTGVSKDSTSKSKPLAFRVQSVGAVLERRGRRGVRLPLAGLPTGGCAFCFG